MTPEEEKKAKVLIQRGDLLFCEECNYAWKVDAEETHDTTCKWHEDEDKVTARHFFQSLQKVGEECRAFGPDIPFGKPPIPVIPIYGWVCAKCQRVFAPHVSECPHCQPGACGASRLDGEV